MPTLSSCLGCYCCCCYSVVVVTGLPLPLPLLLSDFSLPLAFTTPHSVGLLFSLFFMTNGQNIGLSQSKRGGTRVREGGGRGDSYCQICEVMG